MNSHKVFRSPMVWICFATVLVSQSNAQQLPIFVEKPHAPLFLRSYKGATVPPIRLMNSDRLHRLIRAGILYLTVQDALALAIENNLNLEAQRYALPIADWAVERAQAGGPIRGVPGGAPQVGIVDAGLGVLGTIQSAGISGGGGGGGSVGGSGAGGATLQQIGPVVVNFDPSLTDSTTFSHITSPQANRIISQTTALVDVNHVYSTQIRQGLPTGGYVTFRNYEHSLNENAPGNNLNPAVGPHMDFQFQNPLLQGYGVSLNDRGIRVAKNLTAAARETFRSQLLNLVTSVLNLYWNLVSANDELKARQHSLEITQQFYEDTKKEIGVGALARVQLPRAEAEVAGRRQDLILAQVAVRQREALLKEQLVRQEDSIVEAAQVVPLDRIEVPEQDDLSPLRQLVATAMANRPDVALAKVTDENAAINAIGTSNGLLPALIAYSGTSNRGAAGTGQVVNGKGPNPYFVGGYGTALGQIFRRNFPNEYVGLSLQQLPLRNRQAQADYGIEQLQLQQSQLSGRRDANDIVVNVSNQMIALRQARARYTAALNTRTLQEQLLAAEREKFSAGISTFTNLIIDQRALVAAQISELNALAAYARARVSLDQVLGETLETNHITLDEGLSGRILRDSRIPDVADASKN